MADEVRPRALPTQVMVLGLGALPPRLVGEVGEGLKQVLGIGWRPGPALGRPVYAFNEGRGQYHAPAILRRVAALRDGASGAVLGLVDGDLFLPDDGEYVIGDVDRGAAAALVGVARLVGEPAVLRRRAQVEALHVLGYVLGLSGCLDYRCAMFASRDAADVDRKSVGYCFHCRAALGLP